MIDARVKHIEKMQVSLHCKEMNMINLTFAVCVFVPILSCQNAQMSKFQFLKSEGFL